MASHTCVQHRELGEEQKRRRGAECDGCELGFHRIGQRGTDKDMGEGKQQLRHQRNVPQHRHD